MNEKLANWRWAVGGVLLSGGLAIGIVGLGSSDVWADRQEEGYESERWHGKYGIDTGPLGRLYREECGSCHLAYPAGLLPGQSWEVLMSDLSNHFGDNAELLPEDRQAVENYLVERAADRGSYGNRRFYAGIAAGTVPIRITELPYFRHEHDEIPPRWVADNPQVGAFSQCDGCHQSAAEGRFDDDDVVIPGYGRWDD